MDHHQVIFKKKTGIHCDCRSFFVHINVKIMGVSEPDSTFGTGYLAPEEKQAMMATMQKVTEQIMSRTQNMTAFDPNDSYVIGLAERQMRANADLREILYNCDKKGEWSGWKVKIGMLLPQMDSNHHLLIQNLTC